MKSLIPNPNDAKKNLFVGSYDAPFLFFFFRKENEIEVM